MTKFSKMDEDEVVFVFGNRDDDAIFVTINVDIEDLTCPGQDPLHSWLPMHLPTRTIWGGKTWKRYFGGFLVLFMWEGVDWRHSGH